MFQGPKADRRENMPLTRYTQLLEALYVEYTHRRYVSGDPLEILYRYEDPRDREVAGLVAAVLAYGRAGQIVKSATEALERLGGSPARSVRDARPGRLERALAGFKHRFHTGEDLTALLLGVRRALLKHGSLEKCFQGGSGPRDETVLPALCGFVRELNAGADGKRRRLLPDPAAGSACKRLHLYLRWMVRKDDVDPGGWDSVPPAGLVVPLDTHMHRIGRTLGAIGRKSADGRAAQEMTRAFRRIRPDDPVRYDFALTRLGIRRDADMDAFFAECGKVSVQSD